MNKGLLETRIMNQTVKDIEALKKVQAEIAELMEKGYLLGGFDLDKLLEAQAVAHIAQSIRNIVGNPNNSIGPLAALREMKIQLTGDVMSGRYDPSSTGPTHNAVSLATLRVTRGVLQSWTYLLADADRDQKKEQDA